MILRGGVTETSLACCRRAMMGVVVGGELDDCTTVCIPSVTVFSSFWKTTQNPAFPFSSFHLSLRSPMVTTQESESRVTCHAHVAWSAFLPTIGRLWVSPRGTNCGETPSGVTEVCVGPVTPCKFRGM
jgi:hypothetical protein